MQEIQSEIPQAKLELLEINLGELSSIRKFVATVNSRYPAIHLLINNAGVSSFKPELQKTNDGFELHMGVNHLGPFLLTKLLLPNLKAGAPSRIVNVGSTALLQSKLKLDDLMMTEKFRNSTLFTGISRLPYNNSKMANALFGKELGRRLELEKDNGMGVRVYSLCPGLVKTEVFRDTNWMQN